METIGNLWWLWLLGMLICWGYVLANQYRRIKTITELDLDSDDDPIGLVSKGVLPLFVSSFLGWGFGILLLISVIVNIIEWAK